MRVRYLLERGRALNSSGSRSAPCRFSPMRSRSPSASTTSSTRSTPPTCSASRRPAERLAWNLKALALAEAAADTRARDWRASLYHNIGWTWFDDGDALRALDFWQKALAMRETMGDAGRIRVAKWTVARGYRAVGRLDDAEKIQKALVVEFDALGEPDGYVYEELAEIALARGDAAAAQPGRRKRTRRSRTTPTSREASGSRGSPKSRQAEPPPPKP